MLVWHFRRSSGIRALGLRNDQIRRIKNNLQKPGFWFTGQNQLNTSMLCFDLMTEAESRKQAEL